MKKILFLIGGFFAAAVGFLVLGARHMQPVQGMTHQPEAAWADRHTAA